MLKLLYLLGYSAIGILWNCLVVTWGSEDISFNILPAFVYLIFFFFLRTKEIYLEEKSFYFLLAGLALSTIYFGFIYPDAWINTPTTTCFSSQQEIIDFGHN